MLTPDDTPAARFWVKVDRSGGPESCWIWTAGKFADGYGAFFFDGRTRRAQAVALELSSVPVPRGLFACHRCDVPLCCNPAHLFVGSPADNSADMVTKRRQATGEMNGNSRMTRGRAESLIADMAGGLPSRAAARKYGISKTQALNIARGDQWKHLRTPAGDAGRTP